MSNEIIHECELGGVKLCDHTTSLLWKVSGDIRALRVSGASGLLHPDTVFHRVDDGAPYTVARLRNWHETMMSHKRTRRNTTRGASTSRG